MRNITSYLLLLCLTAFSVTSFAGIKSFYGSDMVTSTMAVGKSTVVDSKAAFEVVSTTKGMLPPRMTTTQRDNISSPSTGLTIYNTTTNAINVYTGSAWVAYVQDPTIATGDILYRSTTGSIDRKAPGLEGQFILSGGSGAGPIISFGSTTASITSNRTLNCSDTVARVSSSGGAFTLTLPSAVTCPSKIFKIVSTAVGSNAGVNIATTGGQTVGAYASGAVILNTAGDTLEVASDGTNWQITNFGIKVGAYYNGQPTGTINGSTDNIYPTKVNDVNTDYNTGTGVYTVRYAGYYDLQASALISITTGSVVYCTIAKNGSVIIGMQLPFPSNFTNSIAASCGFSGVYLAAGDTISMRYNANGSPTFNATANYHWFSISRQ